MARPRSSHTSTRRLPASSEAILEAARVLAEGGLVAFPTETVYGLGADASNDEAIAALYAAKGRPAFNPLIAHVVDAEQAEQFARLDGRARALVLAFWPGPLTLIAPAAPDCGVSLTARAGLQSLALRAPAHPIAQSLLRALGRPIVAPSANRSGAVSPTEADHVLADLDGQIDLILDGGATRVGVESTIVSCLDERVRLLRPGGVPRDAIEAVLGEALAAPEASRELLAPGMLASHYAPRATVRLEANDIREGEFALDFAGLLARRSTAAAPTLDLSPAGDLDEAASKLFAYLRRLDDSGAATIAVAPIPNVGIGEAINDRLRRAAAPRALLRP